MTNVNCIFLMSSDRLWRLKFFATPDKKASALGSWAISLSIVNPSPPTWLDSRIVIAKSQWRPLPLSIYSRTILSEWEGFPIKFKLQTKSHPLRPPSSTKTKLSKIPDELVAHFAENAASSELQDPYAYFCFSSRTRCSPNDPFYSVTVLIIRRAGPSE